MRTRSRLLPSLPTEIQAHILTYCDTQTLGRASLVSLAFLELASPLLYTHVNVTGFNQFGRMFYDEDRPSSAPHLDHLLTLSRTVTFSFVGTPENSTYASNSPIFRNQRSSSASARRVRVSSLSACFSSGGRPYPAKTAGSVFDVFDPERVFVSSSAVFPPLGVPCVALDAVRWTRLRTLENSGLCWVDRLSEAPFYRALPAGSLTVTYDLRTERTFDAMVVDLIEELEGDTTSNVAGTADTKGLLSPGQPQIVELIVKTSEPTQKTEAEIAVRLVFEALGLPSHERDRRQALIRYVVD